MRYLTGKEAKEAEEYMKIAAEYARNSNCRKSQRGAVIVKDRKIIGRGYNKVTIEELCNPCIREAVKDNSRVELCSAIHAEQMAIIDAANNGKKLIGSRMYHIKVKNGEMRQSGKPSCTVCSRMIYDVGIEFVLWHEDGYALYNPKEFNELSFKYFLKK